jgi:hypothetical protein
VPGTQSKPTYTGIYDLRDDANETWAMVNAVMAFLQKVVVRPPPEMEDWNDDEKYGIYLVFEEVRSAIRRTTVDLENAARKAALLSKRTPSPPGARSRARLFPTSQTVVDRLHREFMFVEDDLTVAQ